jgi:hypothetical protein
MMYLLSGGLEETTLIKEHGVSKIVFYLMLNIMAFSAFAEDHAHEHNHDHENEHRQHAAHQHGVASLNWVMEGESLQILLESPAMNVLGFEHEPHDEHEKQQLADALEKLNEPSKVVLLKGGDCKFESAVIMNLFEEDATHDHNHHHDAEHSDINAEYSFTCAKPLELKTITVCLFESFSGFEKIESQWITDVTQGATTLTRDKHSIVLP